MDIQFLKMSILVEEEDIFSQFVKDDMPWVHLDIAGVTYAKKEGRYSPSGASGWGVMTLNRLVRDIMERG